MADDIVLRHVVKYAFRAVPVTDRCLFQNLGNSLQDIDSNVAVNKTIFCGGGCNLQCWVCINSTVEGADLYHIGVNCKCVVA